MKTKVRNKNSFLKFKKILFIVNIISFIITVILEIFNNNNLKSYKIEDMLLFFSVFSIIVSIINIIIFKNRKLRMINIIILILVIANITYFIYYSYSTLDDTIKKPVIYIYPKEDINLTIKLENDNLITSSYPYYDGKWEVFVNKDGNIYDYSTKRNYYALYWEGINNTLVNKNEGFVVKKSDIVSFLEEKLEYLGLNEKEINEFIIYWLPELNKSDYNFIRFETKEEINNYMPINFSIKPDTLIRVYMDYKPVSKNVKVKKQNLIKKERTGFTIVEWGGRKIK